MKRIRSGVYAVTCLYNKKVYIGSSKDCLRRLQKHRHCFRYQSHSCKEMLEDFNSYRMNMFSFTILELTEDYIARESYWIRFYKSNEKQFGYNIIIPDQGSSYGEQYNTFKTSNAKPVIVININTGVKEEFDSLYQFAKIQKLKYKRLQEVMIYWSGKGDKKSYYNWIIVPKDIYNPDYDYINHKKPRIKKEKVQKENTPIESRNLGRKQIKITNLETKEETIFESLLELVKEMKMVKSKVSYCLKEELKQHHGYRIEYTGNRGVPPALR